MRVDDSGEIEGESRQTAVRLSPKEFGIAVRDFIADYIASGGDELADLEGDLIPNAERTTGDPAAWAQWCIFAWSAVGFQLVERRGTYLWSVLAPDGTPTLATVRQWQPTELVQESTGLPLGPKAEDFAWTADVNW